MCSFPKNGILTILMFLQSSVQVISDLGYRPVYMYEMYLNSVLIHWDAHKLRHTPCITAYLYAKAKYKFSFIYVTVIVVIVV